MQPQQPLSPEATDRFQAQSTRSVSATAEDRTVSFSDGSVSAGGGPVSPAANAVILADSATTTVVAVPQQISRFVIRKRLGDGGFGTVYLAHDPILDREIALKVPRGRAAWDAEQTKSFLEEARIAVRLKHPHVITVHEAGTSEDGGVFIAMEYVAGETLSGRLKRGKLSIPDAVRICGQIAEAMHAGHKLGLVHRDLKPANILLDGDGNVKVCDFGLALQEEVQHARRGEMSGTLRYMSPEQLSGNSHLLDGRSDVWSLGVILYECLSGRQPFRGDTRDAVSEEILHRDPKPLRQIDDTIPLALDELCQRCLRRDIANRLPTALDFQQGLAQVTSRQSGRTFRWGPAIGGAVVLFAAIALFAAVALLAPGSFSPRSSVNKFVPNVTAPPNVPNVPSGTLDLLREEPREWVFEPLDKQSIYAYSAKARRLTVHSTFWSAFACGQQSREFTMDIATTHGAQPANVGVFWGMHAEPAGEEVQETCLCLIVQPDADTPAGASLRCYRLIATNDIRGLRSFGNTFELFKTAITVDWRKSVDLKLRTQSGKCTEVTVQSTPVELAFPEATLQFAGVTWDEYAAGECGLISTFAKDPVVFTRALLVSTPRE